MAEINFVRHYKRYNEDVFDVIYESKRRFTYYGLHTLPKTVLKFIENKDPLCKIDRFYGEEFIYKNGVAIYESGIKEACK